MNIIPRQTTVCLGVARGGSSNETFGVHRGIMVEDHKEPAKKIAILEATLELIAEQGFHNTPISQIAEKARVGV